MSPENGINMPAASDPVPTVSERADIGGDDRKPHGQCFRDTEIERLSFELGKQRDAFHRRQIVLDIQMKSDEANVVTALDGGSIPDPLKVSAAAETPEFDGTS